MSSYTYFPGCSLKSTGKAYEKSLLAVFRALGVEMHELEDWNCCGATAYIAVDEVGASALAARNLALAEKQGGDVIAPCSSCYLVLNKTQHIMQEHPDTARRVTRGLDAIGLTYQGTSRVRHPLDVLINDVGIPAIQAKVTKPLKGLKVAPYYGCQIVRPYATFDDRDNPTTMDRLLAAAGAEVVDYHLKTACCGASVTGNVPKAGLPLVHTLLAEAQRREADLIATCCPLCQLNLDGYQDKISRQYEPTRVPVVYFTQLLGLALGIPARELDLASGLVSAQPVLSQRGVAYVG